MVPVVRLLCLRWRCLNLRLYCALFDGAIRFFPVLSLSLGHDCVQRDQATSYLLDTDAVPSHRSNGCQSSHSRQQSDLVVLGAASVQRHRLATLSLVLSGRLCRQLRLAVHHLRLVLHAIWHVGGQVGEHDLRMQSR